MSELEEAIARHRAALRARETDTLARIFRAYQPIRTRLLERINDLADEIEQRQERDDIVPGSLILRQERAVALLQQTQDEMTRLAGESLQPITGGQADAVDLATGHVLELVQALAPDPAILGSFNRLNTPALEAMVGRMSDGAPLQTWLAQFGPQTALDLGTALQRASALGTNPRGVARDLARQLDIAETRLLTLARTEILGSYRDAAIERYREASDFLDGWFWVAARQTRTCFPAGTMVETARGQVPIEQVRVGDYVLTHRCRWRRVSETLARSYAGRMVQVESARGAVVATAEHPFFVEREGQLNWIEAGDLRNGDIGFRPTAGFAEKLNHGVGDGAVKRGRVDPRHNQSVRLHKGRLAFIRSATSRVPVRFIDLKNHSVTGQVEVDGVSPSRDGGFLDVRHGHSLKAFANVGFWLGLAAVLAVTGKRAVSPHRSRWPRCPRILLLGGARTDTKLDATSDAAQVDRRSTAQFTAVPAVIRGAKHLPARGARAFGPRRFNLMPTRRTAVDPPLQMGGNGERASADGARFDNPLRRILTALGAKLGPFAEFPLAKRATALSADEDAGRCRGRLARIAMRVLSLKCAVTGLGAKAATAPSDPSGWLPEQDSAFVAGALNTTASGRIVSDRIELHPDDLQNRSEGCRARTVAAVPGIFDDSIITNIHSWAEELTVYNIEVEEDHSYVAGGYLVHNCLACLALDGRKFPLSEPFQRSHVNCRCSSVPAFKGETRLPIETAGEWFAGQPEGTRRAMIPPTAWEDFNAGRLTLDDFVHLDRDPRWGDRYRQASVSQARANAATRRRSRAA